MQLSLSDVAVEAGQVDRLLACMGAVVSAFNWPRGRPVDDGEWVVPFHFATYLLEEFTQGT
jgi:hypothetical protein